MGRAEMDPSALAVGCFGEKQELDNTAALHGKRRFPLAVSLSAEPGSAYA